MNNKPQICNNRTQKPINLKEVEKTYQDIIITKYETVINYTEDGTKTEKRVPIKVNITKKVNETAKLIKEQTAAEKLAEMERIMSK